MTTREDKPLAPIDNILNSVHVPVYRRLRQSSLKKRSMAAEVKLHLYDFQAENNVSDGKKFKKSQKVRKRARIPIRHNKENAYKGHKYDVQDIFRNLPRAAGLSDNILKEKPLNCENGVQWRKVRADVHQDFFSPVDDDILSVGSENRDMLSDDDQAFHGFDEEQYKDRYGAFVEACGDMRINLGPYNSSLLMDTPTAPLSRSYMTPRPYLTPNPYMTPDPHKTPRKISTPRYSNIPIIEYDGNQLRPNGSSENIDPNDTFHNASYGGNDRYFSTPFKNNSFNSSSLSNLSIEDFNVTNCFGFEEPDNLNEEFLVSPIKANTRKPVILKHLNLEAPSRPQLPLVEDIINQLKHETENLHLKSDKLFVPEIEESIIKEKDISNYLDNSSVDFLSDDSSRIQENDLDLPHLTSHPSHVYDHKHKPARRSYDRPAYLRQRKNSHHEESDEEDKDPPALKEPDKVKNKKPQKPGKKKQGPSKKEVDELEKWAKAFNSQCAQVEAFNLCIE